MDEVGIEMKTKQIPAIIMLLAGAVSVITMYMKHYELKDLLGILLGILIGAYIVGLIIQKVLNHFIPPVEDEKQTPEGEVIEKEVQTEETEQAEQSQPEDERG